MSKWLDVPPHMIVFVSMQEMEEVSVIWHLVFFRYCQYGNLDSWISFPCQENKFRLGFSVSWLHEICDRNLAVVYYHDKTPPGSTTTRKPETTSEHLKAYGNNPFTKFVFLNSFTGSKIWCTSNGRSLDISANQRSPLFPSILEIRLNASHRNVWCLTSICIGECIQIGCKS